MPCLFGPSIIHPLRPGSLVFEHNYFIKSEKCLCGRSELMSATPWLMVTGLFGVGSEDSAIMNLSYFRRAPLKEHSPHFVQGPPGM